MNPTDPLANLADIHLPDPVASWPPAIGWWLLAILAVGLVIGIIVWLVKRYKKMAYRREALAQLATIKSNAPDADAISVAMEISALLKQVAITVFGRHHTAGLNGDAWLQFLDEKGKTQAFSTGEGRALGDDIYKPNVEIDLDQLFQISQQWIEKQS